MSASGGWSRRLDVRHGRTADLNASSVCTGSRARERATVTQKKTGRPVEFELDGPNPDLGSGLDHATEMPMPREK
jgi:hypothetical protein